MSKISLEPNASGAGTFTLAAPNSNTNRTLTLPDASGSIVAADASTGRFDSSNMPAGSVLQVQTFQTDAISTQSIAAGARAQVANVDIDITPFSTNSTFLIHVSCMFEMDPDKIWDTMFSLFRNGVEIGASNTENRTGGIQAPARSFTAENADDTPVSVAFHFTDQPNTTNTVNYALNFKNGRDSSIVLAVNRGISDRDATRSERGMTILTVMEIAG